MVEESSPLLPPADESIESEPVTALEPEPEFGEPTPEPTGERGFVCGCGDHLRSACDGIVYKEYERQRYCVLHYPAREKSTDFKEALRKNLENNDFNFF
jgi:hypothetical protein